jgi:hypothetical protein
MLRGYTLYLHCLGERAHVDGLGREILRIWRDRVPRPERDHPTEETNT